MNTVYTHFNCIKSHITLSHRYLWPQAHIYIKFSPVESPIPKTRIVNKNFHWCKFPLIIESPHCSPLKMEITQITWYKTTINLKSAGPYDSEKGERLNEAHFIKVCIDAETKTLHKQHIFSTNFYSKVMQSRVRSRQTNEQMNELTVKAPKQVASIQWHKKTRGNIENKGRRRRRRNALANSMYSYIHTQIEHGINRYGITCFCGFTLQCWVCVEFV